MLIYFNENQININKALNQWNIYLINKDDLLILTYQYHTKTFLVFIKSFIHLKQSTELDKNRFG